MASRGFIFVSVDENFFNGNFMSSLSRENDGRGWMLLQHLKVWCEWNKVEENPFFEKVDTKNIGLIGHSRGGEAAAIAGNFNRLSRYPDDATVTFDFNFNIKAIIAIAPSDQQYRPASQPNPLENINYLVFQGAHDADEKIPEPENEEKIDNKNDKKKREGEEKKEKIKEVMEKKDKEPLKLSIELITVDGEKAILPLAHFMPVAPVIKSHFSKIKSESSIFGKDYEPTLQTYELPLAVFKQKFPAFEPGQLKVIRFVFDLGCEGVIILDNIGFSPGRKGPLL